MTLFADKRGPLEAARGEIEVWLARERRLQLNPKHWRVCSTAEPSIYLGYRVSRSGVSVGPTARKRLRRKLPAKAAAGRQALTATLLSARGMALFG